MEPINNEYEIKQWDLFILLVKQIRKNKVLFQELRFLPTLWKIMEVPFITVHSQTQ